MTHRESIKAYLAKLDLTGLSVVDWGRGTKPITRYVKGQPASYYGIDKLYHVEADLVIDMTELILLGKFYDVAFCMEVLEHIEDSRALLYNIRCNLKDGGILHLSVPYMFPIHSEEDYWRFTDQGITLLLEQNGFKVEYIEATTPELDGWLVRAVKT